LSVWFWALLTPGRGAAFLAAQYNEREYRCIGGGSNEAGEVMASERERACETDRRPNILFILRDHHAAHAMSCYGSTINVTPNLDRIATEGIRFDEADCTNALCAPRRAAILTGTHSHHNGMTTLSAVLIPHSRRFRR